MAVNATAVGPEALVVSLVCIDDPIALYLIVCCINALAYASVSITYNYRRIHDFLVSLNIAVAFNLFLAVHASPSVAISYGVICVVTLLLYAFYHLFLALGLLSTASVIVGLNFFNVKGVAQRWLSTILGVSVSETVVDVVFLSTSIALLVLYFTVSDAPVVKALTDDVLFSFLMTYAVRYFRFQTSQNRDGGIDRICCDDVEVLCPVWLDVSYLVLFSYFLMMRSLLHYAWDRHSKRRDAEQRLNAPLASVAADDDDDDDESAKNYSRKAVGTTGSHRSFTHVESVPLLVRSDGKK
jgi:hypothetical protein